MKILLIVAILVLAACLAVSWGIAMHFDPIAHGGSQPTDVNLFVEGYKTGARTPLFTAFLTLGSFLLTLKTTILQRLREGYDTEDHEKIYCYHVRQEKESAALSGRTPKPRKYYQGLHDLSVALSLGMTTTIISSLLQVTLGFFGELWSTVICVGVAAFAALTVLYMTWHIFLAHQQWIGFIEKAKQDSISKKNAQAKAEAGEEEAI